MKGEFQFFNKKNGELIPLLDGAKSRNLIVDQFFECLGSGVNGGGNATLIFSVDNGSDAVVSASRWFVIGTGSTPPTLSDTGLENQIASTSRVIDHQHSYSYDTENDTLIFTTVSTRSFSLGGVIGNISEVGVDFRGHTTPWANRFLQSRALIRDSQGNPTTISLGTEDQLVVVYTLTRVANRTFIGSVGGINFEGKLVGYTSPGNRINEGTVTNFGLTSNFRITDQDWVFPAFNGNTFSSTTSHTVSMATVKNTDTKHIRCRWQVPLSIGNFVNGIKGVYILPVKIQIKFDQPIMKTNEDILDIELFTSFENMP